MHTIQIKCESNGHWGNVVISKLFDLIDTKVEIVEDCESADVIMVSHYGKTTRKQKPYIYFSGEPRKVAENQPHTQKVSIGTTRDTDIYVPYFASSPYYIASPRVHDNPQRSFLLSYCASNPKNHRQQFFDCAVERMGSMGVHALGKACGKYSSNRRQVPGHWSAAGLVNTMSNYKFHMAFENTQIDGYVTEKITLALAAGCVPVYWGHPSVVEFFNPDAMVMVSDFPSYEAVVVHLANMSDKEWNRKRNLNPYNHEYPLICKERYLGAAQSLATLIE